MFCNWRTITRSGCFSNIILSMSKEKPLGDLHRRMHPINQSGPTSVTSVTVGSVEYCLGHSSVCSPPPPFFKWSEMDSRYTLARWLLHYGDILCALMCVSLFGKRGRSGFPGIKMMMMMTMMMVIYSYSYSYSSTTDRWTHLRANTTAWYTLVNFLRRVPTCLRDKTFSSLCVSVMDSFLGWMWNSLFFVSKSPTLGTFG